MPDDFQGMKDCLNDAGFVVVPSRHVRRNGGEWLSIDQSQADDVAKQIERSLFKGAGDFLGGSCPTR
jgi:hypothetical protein